MQMIAEMKKEHTVLQKQVSASNDHQQVIASDFTLHTIACASFPSSASKQKKKIVKEVCDEKLPKKTTGASVNKELQKQMKQNKKSMKTETLTAVHQDQ